MKPPRKSRSPLGPIQAISRRLDPPAASARVLFASPRKYSVWLPENRHPQVTTRSPGFLVDTPARHSAELPTQEAPGIHKPAQICRVVDRELGRCPHGKQNGTVRS